MKKYRYYLTIICVYLIFSLYSISGYCSSGRGVGDGTSIPESEEEALSWIEEIWNRATSPNQSGWTFIDQAAYKMTNFVDRQAAKMGMLVPSISTNYYEYYRPALFQHWAEDMYQAQVTPLEWYNSNMHINYKNNGNTEPTRSDVESIDYSRQVMQDSFNVTNNYIQENPLTYTECYIPSYNFLDPNQFNNFQIYSSLKEFMKNQDGYIFVIKDISFTDFRKGYICVVPRINYVDFVGTTNAGIFTNVTLYYEWVQKNFTTYGSIPGATYYQINNDGSLQSLTPSYNWSLLLNNTGFSTSGNYIRVFSSYSKNELVYVFSTLNALKNYNSGSPQPYYLSSDYANYVPEHSIQIEHYL